MRRLTLDTGVLVSAVLVPHGRPGQLFTAWRALRFELVISLAILEEAERVLGYGRIRRKYPISDADVGDLLLLLRAEARFADSSADVSDSGLRDPSDAHVLACAIAGQADAIVSSDADLLSLSTYRGVPIVSVREALAMLDT